MITEIKISFLQKRLLHLQNKTLRKAVVKAIIADIWGLISRLLLSYEEYIKALPRYRRSPVFVAYNQPPASNCQQRAIHFASVSFQALFCTLSLLRVKGFLSTNDRAISFQEFPEWIPPRCSLFLGGLVQIRNTDCFWKRSVLTPLDSDWREAPSCFCSVMTVIGIISKYNWGVQII